MTRGWLRARHEEAGEARRAPETTPSTAFERDCRTLEAGLLYERVLAVRHLASLGSAALSPLCRALEDPCLEVRIAASDALGNLADPRAVPALHATLRRSLLSGSGYRELRWERICRWAWPLSSTACLATTFWHITHTLVGTVATGTLGAFSLLVIVASKWRRSVFPLQRSLVAALHQIAATDGGPEVRACLPELEALAETGWRPTRPGAPDLTDTLRIVKSLPALSAHPLPATEDQWHGYELPLAAGGETMPADKLPVATTDRGSAP